MNRSRLAVLAVFAVLGTTLATSASAAASGRDDHANQNIYLSLGDSLAQGVQPIATGPQAGVNVVTNQGYPDQLLKIERAIQQPLRLVKLGCPNESTGTMINGGICTYPRSSQLAEAVHFLTTHRNHVAFVTLDIGANDVDHCVVITPTGVRPDFACITTGLNNIAANLPTIVAALHAADPNVQMVAMNYFDPLLAVYLFPLPPGVGPFLAQLSLQVIHSLNGMLGAIYAGGSCTFDPVLGLSCTPGTGPVFPVADVATAFSTDAFTTLVPFAGGLVPLDVVRICQWTWMCVPPPVGPNIHANKAGYGVIAAAFAPIITFGGEQQ